MNTIFFISVTRPLDTNATSTYIMTNSLLQGIKENVKKLVFFAICEHKEEMRAVKEYYSTVADIVIPLPSAFGFDLNNCEHISKLFCYSYSISFYKYNIKQAIQNLTLVPDLLITHSPSYESIFYANALRETVGSILCYQFWSDPTALSGILPEQLSIKRFPFKWIEHKAIKQCDKIIYGTKTLMEFQRNLYSDLADKMRYIDIPYVEKTSQDNTTPIKKSLLYAGNYYSNLRNLQPLIDAVSQMAEYTLDVYGSGDCQDPGVKHITFYGRISPDELSALEGRYECVVCLLNHSCIQIPGKIFYDTIKPAKILVISDGPYSDQILAYLSSYERFVFCKNDKEEIMKAIGNLDKFEVDIDRIREKYSPEAIATDLLNGGRKA
ncbi:MAG: hypothetical protein J6M64_08920 [Oscillospiraceae bacterium]|nr:hypothetical protein [Oscillospiraceae bacterium]